MEESLLCSSFFFLGGGSSGARSPIQAFAWLQD